MILLASASPRRRELLAAAGIRFEAAPPDIEELTGGAPPPELVLENARRKARAVARRAGEGALVLGVDTDVALDGHLLGKATSEAHAQGLLHQLSGRTHEVFSGLVVLDSAGAERSAVETTHVTFAVLSDATIERYLASGEWRDRAGAYAVQGLGSMLVERVEGDLSNVIGLPLQRLYELAPEIAAKP
jgi:septum formation protein